MLRTAIIGISGYGSEHLRLLLHGYERDLIKPTAAVVINPEEVPNEISELKELGCRIYADVESMWAEEGGKIDLCMIPSPIATHYPFSRMALENGSHVFVEKPVCASVEEAAELVALAKQKKLRVCVGFQDLYSQQVQECKERILAGDLGHIRCLKSWGSWPRPVSYYRRNGWAGRLKADGRWVLDSPLNNAMAHFLMLMLYWAGDTFDTFADVLRFEAELYRAQDIESFDTVSMRMETDGGPEIFYAVSHSGQKLHHPVVRVEGDKGWMEWHLFEDLIWSTGSGVERVPNTNIDGLREKMIEDVHRFITTGSGSVVEAGDALLHTRIVNALHDHCPILDLPAEGIQRDFYRDAEWVSFDGLVDDLHAAFDNWQLLSEIRPAVYKARPGSCDLSAYAKFHGGFSGSPLAPAK